MYTRFTLATKTQQISTVKSIRLMTFRKKNSPKQLTLFGHNIEFFNWRIQLAHTNVSKTLWYRGPFTKPHQFCGPPSQKLFQIATKFTTGIFRYKKDSGVLISPYPDQYGNKLQRQKILILIYPIYNHNWRNISTIYIGKCPKPDPHFVFDFKKIENSKKLCFKSM